MASPSSSLCSSLASPRAASLGHRRRLAFSSPRKAFQVKASARVDKYSKNDIIVSPSILSANFAKLGDQRQSRCVCKRLSGKFYIGVLLNIHLHADIYDPWNNILVITGWSSFWSDRWNRWKKKREEDEGSNVYNGKQTKRQGKAGGALGDLKLVRELYDFKTLVVLFLIGSVAVVSTILKRKRTYE